MTCFPSWVLVCVGYVGAAYAWGQAPASAPPLVAHKAASAMNSNAVSPTPVSPNSVTPRNDASVSALPGVPPLPDGKATLLGGTIQHVDHVRDRLVLQVFGGGRSAVLYDERTRVWRDGKQTTLDTLRDGERAYVDTTLDGTDIFARNIRIVAAIPAGQSNGQIVEVRGRELLLRDALSPEPVKMNLATNATIVRGEQAASSADLRPGTLVALTFAPGGGGMPTIQRLAIIASPGAAFVFSGRLEHLDLSRGLLVVVDPRDNKSYEVSFDPAARSLTRDLRQGVDVTVQAAFDGQRYEARSIKVISGYSQ